MKKQTNGLCASVEDEEIVKTVWEESLKHDELSQHIAKLHKTNQILSQNSLEKLVMKQEPIGRVKTKQSKEKHPNKKGTCIRFG